MDRFRNAPGPIWGYRVKTGGSAHKNRFPLKYATPSFCVIFGIVLRGPVSYAFKKWPEGFADDAILSASVEPIVNKSMSPNFVPRPR